MAASVSRENGGCETHDILSRLPILQNLTLQKKKLCPQILLLSRRSLFQGSLQGTPIFVVVGHDWCQTSRALLHGVLFPPTVHNCKQQLSRFLS